MPKEECKRQRRLSRENRKPAVPKLQPSEEPMASKKANGYWKDWGNFEKELRAEIAKEYTDENGNVVKKAGEFPIHEQLCKAGCSSLASEISHHGGIHEARRKLGFGWLGKPKNYWKSWENFERELRAEMMKEYRDKDGVFKKAGELPTKPQLERAKRSDLSNAAADHGGFHAIRRKMGQDELRVEAGYWKDWERFRSELEKEIAKEYRDKDGNVFKRAGEFPTKSHLKEERPDLNSACRYHGGLNAIRRKVGWRIIRIENGYWKNWDNFESEIWYEIACEYVDEKGVVIKKAGEFPTQMQLQMAGRFDLGNAVKRHGGLTAIRRKMGHDLIQTESGYWKNWDNFESEIWYETACEYTDERGVVKKAGVVPTYQQLRLAGRSDLINAFKYYGGMNSVRRKLGQGVNKVESGYWKDWERFRSELEKEMAQEYKDAAGTVFKKAGEFPTKTQLDMAGRSDLASAAAEYHGGINSIRRKMGQDVLRVEAGYWKDWERFRSELENEIARAYKDEGGVFKIAGGFPMRSQLERAKRFDLIIAATRHHGGIIAVRVRMGFVDDGTYEARSQIESLLARIEGPVETGDANA